MTEGILYIATGEKAFEEGQTSAKRLKQRGVEYPIVCMTDQTTEQSVFDHIIIINDPLYNNGDKNHNIHRSPFDKTLYLDTDVDVIDPKALTDIFKMLEKFDVVGRVDTGRRFELYQPPERHIDSIDVPNSFPMINGGVFAFRKNEAVGKLFEKWTESFNSYKDKIENPQDQPALRDALYHSSVQFAPLPPEYNFRIPYPHFLVGDVKILHGRAENLEEISEKVNERTTSPWHGRVYIPAYQPIIEEYIRWGDPGDHPVSPVLNPGRLKLFTERVRLSLAQYGLARTAAYLCVGGPVKGRMRIQSLRKSIREKGLVSTVRKVFATLKT